MPDRLQLSLFLLRDRDNLLSLGRGGADPDNQRSRLSLIRCGVAM